jgi:hypothetical protein
MLKKFTPYLAISVFLAVAQSALPGTKLEINAQGDLSVIGADSKPVKTVSVGSVGEIVNADGQAFKLSYGKDLQGALTIIVYPTAEQKQPVNLSYANSDITVSPNAVLTITNSTGGAQLQAGVLGDVTVDGKKIPQQSSVVLNSNGSIQAQPVAATTVATTGNATTINSSQFSAPANPTPDQSGPNSQVAKIKSIWGNAYISKNGAPETLLNRNTEINAGDTLRTGEDGEVQVSFFPNTYTALDKWSKLTIKELYYSDANGAPQRKLVVFLASGKIYSKLNTKGDGATDYQIQTPGGTYKAIGTRFSVQQTDGGTIISVVDGTVTAADGTQIPTGYKGILDGGGKLTVVPLSTEEQIALNNILSSGQGIVNLAGNTATIQEVLQAYNPRLNPQDITPTTPGP